MNGRGFEMEARNVKHIETANRRICTPIPVPGSFPLLEEMQKYEPRAMAGQPLIVWDHTEDGYKICDPYGNRFIDFSSAVMITNSGHGNQELIDAIRRMTDKPLLASYAFPTAERVEAAKELVGVCPIPEAKVFMLSAGTEAVECAFKLARTYGKQKGGPEKKVIVSYESAFHGRTLASQLVGGMDSLKDWIGNLDRDVFQAPWPNGYEHHWADESSPDFDEDKMFSTLLETIDAHGVKYENIAGIVIEAYNGIQCYPIPKSYARKLRQFCDQYDILLIMDEIQTGFCRTGKWFAFQHYGILPDIITAAKGLSGALPMSCVFARREIMDMYAPNTMTSTHSGSPVAAAAAAANIRYMKEQRLDEAAAEKGRIIERHLKALKEQVPDRISYVGGLGLAWACTFADPKTKKGQPEFALEVTKKCVEKGLMFYAAVGAGITMKLTPPLTIPEDALEEGMEAYAEAVLEADAEMPPYED
ncbi:aspartate aminotransferase family protein [Bacilliculturomica massiliensis]|uniref:aspartate aminotransferase family protein n=1 Tax=Bacilliculturomica massiliensis TaxID=1917867 RepID=UPI0010304FD1|nr:aspartate aminotransferase family protein [Bacilliculturomica massiliensis]